MESKILTPLLFSNTNKLTLSYIGNQNYRINLYRDLRAPKIFAPSFIPAIILLSVRGLRFVFTNLVHLEIEIALDQFSIHYPLTFKNQTKENGQKSARKNKKTTYQNLLDSDPLRILENSSNIFSPFLPTIVILLRIRFSHGGFPQKEYTNCQKVYIYIFMRTTNKQTSKSPTQSHKQKKKTHTHHKVYRLNIRKNR